MFKMSTIHANICIQTTTHSIIAAAMMVWSSSLHSFTSWIHAYCRDNFPVAREECETCHRLSTCVCVCGARLEHEF